VGDLLALSVSTPKHLKELNLLTDFTDDYEFNINYLFAQAMDKVRRFTDAFFYLMLSTANNNCKRA
jgi:hypothetical protein